MIKKFLLMLLVLFIVYKSIDVKQVIQHIEHLKASWLALSFIALTLSQLVSAFRMRYYYLANNISCSTKFATDLYFVSMFYNILLPGGITGDVYKIYAMQKVQHVPKITSLRLVLSNRASGLFVLLLITILISFWAPIVTSQIAKGLVLAIAVISFAYFFLAKLVLKEEYNTAIIAAIYSLIIQGFSLLSAYLVFMSMPLVPGQLNLYLMLFMASCVVATLPLSIGGVGLRELTFIYGAEALHLDPAIGTAFAFIYSILNLVLSLTGGLFSCQMK